MAYKFSKRALNRYRRKKTIRRIKIAVYFRIVLTSLLPFIVNGLIMFLILKFVSAIVPTGVAGFALQVCIGVVVYCLLSIIYLILFKKDFALELKNKFITRN